MKYECSRIKTPNSEVTLVDIVSPNNIRNSDSLKLNRIDIVSHTPD